MELVQKLIDSQQLVCSLYHYNSDHYKIDEKH